MKNLMKFILFVVVVSMFVSGMKRNHSRRVQGNPQATPAPSVEPGDARGFNNRTWYGSEQAKDLDPVLTRRNFLIVLDGSGSMGSSQCSGNLSKIVAAKQAIAAFATKLKPEDNLGLCAFDSRGVTERSALSLDRTAFNKALNGVGADSNTPLGTAVKLGYSKLQNQARRQLGYGEYYLVIVTDGEADQGDDPREIVNLMVSESPVVISTIGFCIGEGHSLHRPGLTLYHDATNLEQLHQGLESVLAESEFSSAANSR
jgi:hypothetical protein